MQKPSSLKFWSPAYYFVYFVGLASLSPFIALYYEERGLSGSLMTVALLISIRIPVGHAHISVPFRSGMRTLFSNRRWMFFLLIIFMCGVAAAGTSTYLFLYLKRLGASNLIGLALTLSTVSEVPMLFFAGRLLRRFKARGLILIELPIYIGRLLLYSLVGFPPTILI